MQKISGRTTASTLQTGWSTTMSSWITLTNVDYDALADYYVPNIDNQENHTHQDTDYIHHGLIDYAVFRPAGLVLEELRSSRFTGPRYFIAPA